MTDDEKREQRRFRDAAICRHYQAGHTVAQCASAFRLGRMRTFQILQKAEVLRPRVKVNRTKHLGVMINEDDKAALTEEAKRRGVSTSELTSDLIRDMLAERGVQ